MNNTLRNMKKNRPLSAAEQAGMEKLLAGLKKLREIATGKPSVAQGQAGGDVSTSIPIT